MMMTKTQKGLIKAFCFVLCVLTLFMAVYMISSCKQDYTEEYRVYCELKTIPSFNELRTTLSQKGIEYKLDNNILTLKGYDNIRFDVLDDGKANISTTDTFKNFEILDSETITNIKIEGKEKDGQITEIKTLSAATTQFIKAPTTYKTFNYANVIYAVIFFIVSAFAFIVTFRKSDTQIDQKKEKVLNEVFGNP